MGSRVPHPGVDDFSPVAGKWTGPVAWADGSTGTAQWIIDADGRTTMPTDTVTLNGQLQKQGDRYTFVIERSGQACRGTMVRQERGNQIRLSAAAAMRRGRSTSS